MDCKRIEPKPIDPRLNLREYTEHKDCGETFQQEVWNKLPIPSNRRASLIKRLTEINNAVPTIHEKEEEET